MIPSKNLPMLLNLAYVGYNRGLPGPGGVYGDFQPIFNSDGSLKTSFCNQFVSYVCNGLGYTNLTGMMANQMVTYMQNPANGWISPTDENAVQTYANSGIITLAGFIEVGGHGHICLILPGILEKSMSWGKAVPKVANIGKDVFFGKRISFAFQANQQPNYFCLAGQI